MTTRDSILQLSDQLIRDRGFNGFSFHDISKTIGIKTASIHYYFPTKSELGAATVRMHQERLEFLRESLKNRSPQAKLEGFFSIYDTAKREKRVCLVGSLATDLNTVEDNVKVELKILAASILEWVIQILEEGKAKRVFYFAIPARTKALMVITNMLAIVQLMRLTGEADFEIIKKAIVKELKSK